MDGVERRATIDISEEERFANASGDARLAILYMVVRRLEKKLEVLRADMDKFQARVRARY